MAYLEQLLEVWNSSASYQDFLAAIQKGRHGGVFGLSGSLSAMAASRLAQDVERPVLVITAGFQEARRLEAEMSYFLPRRRIHIIPPRVFMSGSVKAESQEGLYRRLVAIDVMRHDERAIILAPAEAARQMFMSPSGMQWLELVPGKTMSPESTAKHLRQLGYNREPEVVGEGQFAWRGAIMDVYSPGQSPVRIEWFDDEIDSLRTFNLSSQRTVEMIQAVRLGPARELIWTDEKRRIGLSMLSDQMDRVVQDLEATGRFDKAGVAKERFGSILHHITEDMPFPGMERYAAAFGKLVSIPKLFSMAPLIIYDDAMRVFEVLKGQEHEEHEETLRRIERGDWLPVEKELTLGHEVFPHAMKGFSDITLSLMPHQRTRGGEVLTMSGRPAPRIHGQTDLLKNEIDRMRKSRHRIVIVARDTESAELIQRQIMDLGFSVRQGWGDVGEISVLQGQLHQGFVVADLRLAVLGETELTGRDIRPQIPRKKPPKNPVRLADLKSGDYVVHMTHGIGRFLGIKTLEIQDQHKDYLHVQYAGTDTLYVPVDQLNLVQKYIGVEGHGPKLSKMGGAEWNRAKDKVKASVREMAEELIKIYAVRESQPGLAFGPDTPWQAEFESAFAYQETDDQLRAIQEIKINMELGRPMDRLLCGDVGYGKTEVALRAAFKAIMAGKQVAFLVPTTLLAEQHFKTARERMAGFPITVDVISRFRSTSQQRQIVQKAESGQIDLLVGTHRLLGKDVKFRDLGLLIIDEEHRFGVAHKERIKALKENVDVLTLSATPIPRTLHMALVGLRDMSLIETPPEDRLPVETAVVEFDWGIIREAIRREIDRDGQVFYVQNRIKAMDNAVSQIMKMFPDLRVAVVHGQMDETRIEDIMARFIAQEYDVLVATSIIESGLDIPNANTIIVEDADKMGLAQLYQLRGRVGRSARLAYAYFTFRPNKVLTIPAEKRLEAIREFTELGAGYQIALRDLEIRGAGNLLGAEQHGFIASVGFDLYTDMLSQAVRELRGQPVELVPEPVIEMAVDAYLPDNYVVEPRLKIDLYKRLVSAGSLDIVAAIHEEIEDRFGPMPEAVANLVRLSEVRVLAKALRLTGIAHKGERLIFRTSPDTPIGSDAIQLLAHRYPGRILPSGKSPELGVRLTPRLVSQQILETSHDILSAIKEAADRVKTESG